MDKRLKMFCEVCGTPYNLHLHHLECGRGTRLKADKDNLVMTLCEECHRTIHNEKVAYKLGRMVGQMLYMLQQLGNDKEIQEAKEKYLKRYGKNQI